jgi:membrane associated rhomboid family serine protease
MLPRLQSTLITRWIAVTLGLSIISALDRGFVASWAALVPARVFRGELWRLVTWPLIEAGPIQLVMTCAAIYKFGGELAVRWGDRRLQRFMLELVIAAGVITCLLSALFGMHYFQRLGGWLVIDVLIIAWARQFPQAVLRFYYGMLELHGRQLIGFVLGMNLLFAIYFGPFAVAPELVACIVAARYPVGWLRR